MREFEIILLQTQSLSIKPFNKRQFSFIKNTLKNVLRIVCGWILPKIEAYITYN
jgi:hypothetical protein